MNSTKILVLLLIICIQTPFLFNQPRKKAARIINKTGIEKIENITQLNSKSDENNLSITPDGKYIYFMSERQTAWSTKDTTGKRVRYDGNIWFSKKLNQVWRNPVSVSRNINTPQNEDEPNISPDGQTVYYQSWRTGWEDNGGPYYKAELSGETWKNPVGLGGNITRFFREQSDKNNGRAATDGSTFSIDGKTFIFAFGDDYFGNMDLYISHLLPNGDWSYPEALQINTPFNERCPFLAPDSKTLYFASNGYDGFGNLDIYKTVLLNNNTFGEIINIGEPINTKNDDYGFVLTSSGDESYFIHNGDIFFADLINANGEIKPLHTIILTGTVRDAVTKNPIESNISVIETTNNKPAGESRSNSTNGEYSIVLQRGKTYKLITTKKDYNDFITEFEFKYDLNVREMKIDIDLISTKIDLEPECLSKLYERGVSLGLIPAFPLAVGLKTEINFRNFGFSLIGMFLPSVGQYDETKPPEDMMSDNYSTLFMFSLSYNFPAADCRLYPFIGVFTGYRTRYWKKPISEYNIGKGKHSDYPFGGTIGLKYFLDQNIFIEGAIAGGRFAFHDFSTGNISKYEFKFIPWLLIAYKF